MFSHPRAASVALALAPALASLFACASESSPGAAQGVACTLVKRAASIADAQTQLDAASSGQCVALAGGSYAGSLRVPSGVTLTTELGADVVLQGGSATEPVVTLAEGATLAALTVRDAAGVGVAVRASRARVDRVTVSGAKGAALAVLCKDAACGGGDVVLEQVVLEKSALGLWVSGAHLTMKGGKSSEHTSTSLASAAGIVAQEGANLALQFVVVEKNQGVGILIDGAKTRASLLEVTVSENGERGIWAQKVAGTVADPAVRIEASTLVKNRIVGLGGLEARGIIVVGGRIADTVAAPVVTDLAKTESVGDGVGLFSGSGEVKLENVTVEANARAAGVIDAGNAGIIVVGGKVAAGAQGLKFVVQNTAAKVDIEPANLSAAPSRLGISAPKLSTPPVL